MTTRHYARLADGTWHKLVLDAVSETTLELRSASGRCHIDSVVKLVTAGVGDGFVVGGNVCRECENAP